jgi:hypothetical protein
MGRLLSALPGKLPAFAAGCLLGALFFLYLKEIAGFYPAMGVLPAFAILGLIFLHLRFEYQLLLMITISYFPGHQLLTFFPIFLWAKEAIYRGVLNFRLPDILGIGFILFSHFFNQGKWASFVFYAVSAWYWWFLWKWLEFHELDEPLIKKVIHAIFFFQALQLAVFIPDFLRFGSHNIGDGYLGTMRGANFYLAGKTILGFILAAMLFAQTRRLIYLVLFWIMLLTWLMMLKAKGNFFLKIGAGVAGTLGLIALMSFFDSDIGMIYYFNQWLWDIGKLKVFNDTYHYALAHWPALAVGMGPGNFISRSAMIMTGGIDTMYSQYLPSLRLPFADQLIYPTFTKELMVATTGSILSTPNSTLFALAAELGLPFTAFLMYRLWAFWDRLKAKAKAFDPGGFDAHVFKGARFYFTVLLLLSSLDYWLDYSSVVIPLMLLLRYFDGKPDPAPAGAGV